MSCDIVELAIFINNTLHLNKIPFDFLTRIETTSLISLDILKLLSIDCIVNTIKPYKDIKVEDEVKLKYQPLCSIHLKEVFKKIEKNGQYIYISMNHFEDKLLENKNYKNFCHCFFHHQFHFVLKLINFNQNFINVEPVIIHDKSNFLKHQKIAREKEKNYNLIYNVEKYIRCPCCLATICGLSIYHKEIDGKLPTKLSQINNEFNRALILIKNDRINIESLCKNSQIIFKCDNLIDYYKKIYNICKNLKWNYDDIISVLHDKHYKLLKQCELLRDKNCDSNKNWK